MDGLSIDDVASRHGRRACTTIIQAWPRPRYVRHRQSND